MSTPKVQTQKIEEIVERAYSDKNNEIEVERYLQLTPLLDFNIAEFSRLVEKKNWCNLSPKEKIQQIYLFVRNEILFGYNPKDEIPASQILKEGIGQCNTKATLLMALLRAVGIPCRFHGFTIDKALQKGAFSKLWFPLVPKNIIHSWVEVWFNGEWFHLEGVILDSPYLHALQKKFGGNQNTQAKNFCGYGVYTEDLLKPAVNWNENHTYIQKLGINQDFGLFDSPDSFYQSYGQEASALKKWLFKHVIRKSNNNIVSKLRGN